MEKFKSIIKKIKRKILGDEEQALNPKNFMGYLSFGAIIATVILLAYGFIALTILDVDSDIAITALISGLFFMFAAIGLLIAVAKIKPCSEETSKARKQFTKGLGLISSIIVVILAVAIPVFTSISIGNKFMSELKDYMAGKTFVYKSLDGADSEIEFTSKNACVIRYIDRSGYTEKTVSENEYKYSVKGKEEAVKIIIGKSIYTYDGTDSFIHRMEYEGKTFEILSLQDDIKYPSHSNLISSYDAGIKGFSENSSYGVSDSLYIACAKDLISDTLKNPYSARFSSERLVAKDNYGRGIVYLEVTATNSFGAYITEKYYVCVKNVTSDGKYTQSSIAAYTTNINDNSLAMLKTANDFGEHPNDDATKGKRLGNIVIPEPTEVIVRNKKFNVYTLTNDYATYSFYAAGSRGKDVMSVSIRTKSTTSIADAFEIFDEMYYSFIDNGEVNANVKVFNKKDGLVTTEPMFVKGGYILQCASENGEYIFTVTNGRALGFPQNDYWTPIHSLS